MGERGPEGDGSREVEPQASGRVLDGRYRLEEQLGVGGGGVVYRAHHLRLGKDVAVKVLAAEHATDASLRRRFEREARATAALTHPHIVGTSDFGVADGTPYLVMDLLRGVDLAAYLVRHGALPLEMALAIAQQVLDALAHAHAEGLIHRDLKPHNIYLQDMPGGQIHVRVLDFGLSKFVSAERRTVGPALTRSGMVLGTPAYMAPEQIAASAHVDARADVYSLGIVLYEILAGERPFTGTPMDIARQHLMQPLPSIAAARPELEAGPQIDALLSRATAKEPEARFADAGEMLQAVRELQSGGGAALRVTTGKLPAMPAVPKVNLPTGRRARLAMAAGALLLALAAVLAWWTSDAPQVSAGAAPGEGEDATSTAEDARPTEASPGVPAPLPDPWAKGVPEELAPIARRIRAGNRVSNAMETRLRKYYRAHDDARALLLLARAYVARGWRPDGLEQYLKAYEADPTVRGDPAMLDDLLALVEHGATSAAARKAVQDIYGRHALAAVRERLATPELDAAQRSAYARLQKALEAKGAR